MVHTAINIAFLDPQKVLEASEEDTKAPVEVWAPTSSHPQRRLGASVSDC